jgi:hypothetical protein
MPILLRDADGDVVTPNEESTLVISGAFRDEADAAVTPTSATWRLTDTRGTVINSRDGVTITPATTYTIVLTGPDLPVSASYADGRRVLVAWRYDSTNGTALYGKEEIQFTVTDLAGET